VYFSRDAKAGIIQTPLEERKWVLLAIKRLSQGKFPRAEQLRSNHVQAFGQLIRVQRMSQQGRLVWSIDVNRQSTPSQVRESVGSLREPCAAATLPGHLYGPLTCREVPRQVVKVWAYTVEGHLPAVLRRVEAALRMYSQEYVARCSTCRTLCSPARTHVQLQLSFLF